MYYVHAYIGRHSAITKLKLEATEKFNMLCRLKEEELLLLKEMQSYIAFYQRLIASLVGDVQGILCFTN